MIDNSGDDGKGVAGQPYQPGSLKWVFLAVTA